MTTGGAPNPALKAYEEKIRAQLDEAKAKLSRYEAQAKEAKAQAEISIINSAKTARENIDRKLHDLKTMHDADMTRGKADIDSAVAKFKASVDEVGAKLKEHM